MSNVHPLGVRPFPRNFVVRVERAMGRGPEDATLWVAHCDALRLSTEARTCDALIERVRALVSLNYTGIDPATALLRFEYETPMREDERVAV